MSVKNITLTEEFLPNITSIDEIKEETRNILDSFYHRFMNERNYNNLTKALNDLENYRYIHKNWIIPKGRYIKYILTDKPLNMVLQHGGVISECNKYHLKIFAKGVGYIYLCRKECLIFMKLNEDDHFRSELMAYE